MAILKPMKILSFCILLIVWCSPSLVCSQTQDNPLSWTVPVRSVGLALQTTDSLFRVLRCSGLRELTADSVGEYSHARQIYPKRDVVVSYMVAVYYQDHQTYFLRIWAWANRKVGSRRLRHWVDEDVGSIHSSG